MTFNELNSVEHFIISQLSGINLNNDGVDESKLFNWKYIPSEELDRDIKDVLVDSDVRKALVRINPEIEEESRADEVIHKLKHIINSVQQTGLVRANEEFAKWLQNEKSMPFGEDNHHVPVRLIDFENLENNSFVITNQFKIRHRETKIPDVVLMINGIPIVVGRPRHPYDLLYPGWMEHMRFVIYTKIVFLNYLCPIFYLLQQR